MRGLVEGMLLPVLVGADKPGRGKKVHDSALELTLKFAILCHFF
jgi:hypothetical protein